MVSFDRMELTMLDKPDAAGKADTASGPVTPKPRSPAAKRKGKTAGGPVPKGVPVAIIPLEGEVSPTTTTAMPSRYKLSLTIALGVLIPLLSLTLSKISGTLASHGSYALATFAAGIGAAVLVVSLSHLAWAVRDVTGSGLKASWALAVALDLSLVLGELVHVTAAAAGLDAVCWCVVVVVAGFSMVLNCHAFITHKSS